MPKLQHLPVSGLLLDLNNYRTLPQTSELEAVHAMITVDASHFWGLMESLLDDGFTPTENLVVSSTAGKEVRVREGNRRAAVLKICHKLLPFDELDVPESLAEKIRALPAEWLKANERIPCAVFSAAEEMAVKRVVGRVHGKAEASGRARWESIAKARHNRDDNNASEPGLDLLEKFFKISKEIAPLKVQLWAGSYPLTILDEALKRLAPRMGYKSAREIADAYPKVGTYRKALDSIIIEIGNDQVGFDRGADDSRGVRGPNFGVLLGIPAPTTNPGNGKGTTPTGGTAPPGSNPYPPSSGGTSGQPPTGGSGTPQGPSASNPGYTPPIRKPIATPVNDPRTVKRELKRFIPRGSERAKLASLIQELRDLKLDKVPHAFCFVLRSVFELSARAYCNDHGSPGGPQFYDSHGEARKLKDILVDIIHHLSTDPTTGKKVQAKSQLFHGASTELKDADSLLSVTSMNSLVHSQTFTVSPHHICVVFAKILPLLKAMNA